MIESLHNDCDVLIEFVEQNSASRDGQVRTVAEACFRLGVHPDISPQERLHYLYQAFKRDGTNPRHAYHIGRLYFRHNELEQAANWLTLAEKLCPTSHRVWAHISLLHRELNARDQGKTEYEPNVLKGRGDRIAKKVENGEDAFEEDLLDFKQKKSQALLKHEEREQFESAPARLLPSVPRIADKGKCRWSGIYDLDLETGLEDSPTVGRLKELYKELEKNIEQRVEQRRNGVSAFVLLAIEWLVAGYPVGTIRRLMERRKDAFSSPSGELLKTVCQLYEANDNELPALLARNLDAGCIPPFLATCIHQQRLLWLPLEFRQTTDYYFSKKFLGEIKHDADLSPEELAQVQEYQKDLEEFAKLLRNPPTPSRLQDIQPSSEQKKVEDDLPPAERVSKLEAQADEMLKRLDENWAVLAQDLPGDPKLLTPEQTEQALAIREYVRTVDRAGAQALADIDSLRATGKVTNVEALDRVQEKYRKVVQQMGRFKARLKKLNLPEKNAPAPGTVAETANGNGSNPPATPLGPLERLERSLDEVDTEIDRLFSSVNATFNAYSSRAQELTPLKSLMIHVWGREAETYYRMDRKREARQLWHAILQADRLNVAAAKNLAVCDSGDTEIARAMSSWRTYCDNLYAQAVMAGDPRFKAKERAEFHRDYASAFAPPNFNKKLEQKWHEQLDSAAVVSFLQSSTRMRSFLDHTILDFFNRKLDLTSPTLILGVRREDPAAMRSKAKTTLLALVDEVGHFLPQPSGAAFVLLCKQYLERAHKSCENIRDLELRNDPNYTKELDVQLQWTHDLVELLYKFRNMLVSNKAAQRALNTFESLEQLDRLVHLPFGLSASLLTAAARSFSIPDFTEFLKDFDALKQQAVLSIMSDMFKGTNGTSESVRRHQYRRLIDYWVKQPLLKEYIDWLDDPQQFYPDGVIEALKGNRYDGRAVAELRRWHEQYPELTGPAIYLAILLMREERQAATKVAEIKLMLVATMAIAFCDQGREKCKDLINQLEMENAIKSNDYQEVAAHARQMLQQDPADSKLRNQLFAVYKKWIEYQPNNAISLIPEIKKDFEDWQASRSGNVGDDTVEQAREQVRQLTAYAAIIKVHISKNPDESVLKQSRETLGQILDADPQNVHALYYRMSVCWELAGKQGQNIANAKPYILDADAMAEKLLANSKDPQQQGQASKVREQVRQLRSKL